jgi:hypothetical protein
MGTPICRGIVAPKGHTFPSSRSMITRPKE